MKSDFIHPRVGVALAIRRQLVIDNAVRGTVLLHKRASPHARGHWGFPGGHLELWESFEDAAIRETIEEAGSDIKITTPKFWTALNTPFPEEDKHYVTIFMVADWIMGEAVVMEPEKNDGWAWIAWDSLPDPLMLGIKLANNLHLNPWTV